MFEPLLQSGILQVQTVIQDPPRNKISWHQTVRQKFLWPLAIRHIHVKNPENRLLVFHSLLMPLHNLFSIPLQLFEKNQRWPTLTCAVDGLTSTSWFEFKLTRDVACKGDKAKQYITWKDNISAVSLLAHIISS